MKGIRTEIVIDAPVAQVWEVLMDFDAYADWNPLFKHVSGNPAEGGTLSVLIQPNEKQGFTFSPTVLANKPPREFRWKGTFGPKRLFQGEHYFELRSLTDVQTHLIHGERFSGWLSFLLIPTILEAVDEGFHAMNDALKVRVEG